MGMGSFGAFRMSSKPLFSDDPSITSSTSITETVTGAHEFTIRGYSLSKGIGVGNPLVSDTFIVGGHAWAIHFFPDGKSEEDNSAFVSVFISLLSAGSDVRALFELTLLDQTGKGNHKVHTHFEQPRENGPYTLHGYGSMWGYKRFFKRSLLETSDYLKDDRLLIHCRIGVVKCNTVGPKTYSITVPPSTIGQHFGQLLESGEGTDVNFEIDGEIVPAHKLVLAARSPVFKAQFFGPLKEKNSACIKVDDMEAPVFKALLHFMYWDELPDVETFTGLSTKWASTLIAQHLLAAADLYGLERLKLLCEAKLCEDVAINTVANTLVLAEQHGCVQLKALCLKFVSMPENLRAVTQTDGFNYLKDSCPALLGEILENVANAEEHPLVITTRHEGFRIPDGGDIFGRRLKRRMP